MRPLVMVTIAAGFLTASGPIYADDLPDYDSIRTPDSPAFTVLGISPTQVDRPNTPNQIAVSLGGFLADGGAIEIAPYWLWSRPTLTIAEYQNGAQQLARNVSISLGTHATAGDATTGTEDSTAAAFGVRTSAMLSARPNGCDDKIRAAGDAAASRASDEALGNDADTRAALAIADPERREQALRDLKSAKAAKAETEAADTAATECVRSGDPDARGLAIELAAATSVSFAGNELDAAALSTSAAWASLAYKWVGASVVALTRLRRDLVMGGSQYVLVPGVRAIYAHGRMAASLEAVAQMQVRRSAAVEKLDSTYRVTAGLDVRVADETWLILSFGKDLGDDSTGQLFSLANLKWGWGDPAITAK